MNIESLLEMWKKDAPIDEMALDEASRDSAKLHSKYLELYSVARLRLKKLELDFKPLLRDKFLHYGGKLSQEDLDTKGWEYDPLNGVNNHKITDLIETLPYVNEPTTFYKLFDNLEYQMFGVSDVVYDYV